MINEGIQAWLERIVPILKDSESKLKAETLGNIGATLAQLQYNELYNTHELSRNVEYKAIKTLTEAMANDSEETL